MKIFIISDREDMADIAADILRNLGNNFEVYTESDMDLTEAEQKCWDYVLYISFYRNLILTLNEKGIFVNSSLFHLNIQIRNGKAYDWRCIVIHLVYYINFFFHVLYPSLFHDMTYYSKHRIIFKQIEKLFLNLFYIFSY